MPEPGGHSRLQKRGKGSRSPGEAHVTCGSDISGRPDISSLRDVSWIGHALVVRLADSSTDSLRA